MYTTALVLLFIIKIWKNSNNFFEHFQKYIYIYQFNFLAIKLTELEGIRYSK